MAIENAVMTPYEVAKETHLSLRFIYKLMRAGKIPHIKAGDRYLIGREAFLKWVNSSQTNNH